MITLFALGLCSNLSSDNAPSANIGSLCEYLRVEQGTLRFSSNVSVPFILDVRTLQDTCWLCFRFDSAVQIEITASDVL